MHYKDHVSLVILAILFAFAIFVGIALVSCSSETTNRKVCIYDNHNIPHCHYEDSMGRPIYNPRNPREESFYDEDGI